MLKIIFKYLRAIYEEKILDLPALSWIPTMVTPLKYLFKKDVIKN